MKFIPKIEHIKSFDLPEDEKFIKEFPSLYRSDIDFAMNLCKNDESLGFFEEISKISSEFKYCSIDTRISMLMPGWFPCIPGWHCDDFYRPNGQPAISRCEAESPMEHYLFQLGNCCHTAFIDEIIDLPSENDLDLSETSLYGHYAKMIDRINPRVIFANTNTLIKFSQTTLHRGSFATVRGWRLFCRITYSNSRLPKNEERRQSQVYIPSIDAGW